MICTIFKNILTPNEPNYITIAKALERIKSGSSKARVEEIRATIDKEKAQQLKKELPSVCFSGKFSKRYDKDLIEHSGFIVLDFDLVDEIDVKAAELANKPFCYALWVSPSGNGLKMLVRVADGKKHREHFAALQEAMPEIDKSGVNESRVCYESYDPNIYINEKSEIYTRTAVTEKIQERKVLDNEHEIFKNILKWQANRGGAFVSGSRNTFIFKLAGACCRFGLWVDSAINLILTEYPASNDFTQKEAVQAIKSGYRANANKAGSAVFEREILVDKTTRKEVVIEERIYDISEPSQDVIYGSHVKENAIHIFRNGYESVKGIGAQKVDELFKMKRGEITCFTGVGNYGKSTYYKWMLLNRSILYGEKWAGFVPEENPAEEFYHDLTEMLLGANCTPTNPDGTPNMDRPSEAYFNNAYDWVTKHFFYLYPQKTAPTPEYVKERFLEMIFKEKIDGVYIDPFNQLAHIYEQRSDQYLEVLFGDFHRFAQANNVYLTIVAHPTKMKKDPNGNYPCPDVYDLAGGAMWNNKMDNVIVYHRPFKQTDPSNPICEFHSKKIRRQKTVGKCGFVELEYIRRRRRFEISGHDIISNSLAIMKLDFNAPVGEYKPIVATTAPSSNNFFAGFQNHSGYNPNDWKE